MAPIKRHRLISLVLHAASLASASTFCQADQTPGTDPRELQDKAIVYSNTQEKGGRDETPPDPERVHRFQAGIRVGGTVARPLGVQEILRDRYRKQFYANFSVLGAYKGHRRGTFQLALGREYLKLDTIEQSTDDDFVGSYQIDGYPAFAYYAYDLFVSGGGIPQLGEPARWRFTVQPALGIGASFLTRATGYNQFKEKITTKRYTAPGAHLRIGFGIVRDTLPVGLDLGLGYRYYQRVSLGNSGRTLSMSGPSVDLSIIVFL